MFCLRPSRLLWRLLAFVLALVPIAFAQIPATTLVSGTLYRANGQPAAGSIVISWPAFTTSEGRAIAAGTQIVRLSPAGAFSVPLAPTVGASPAVRYAVAYRLSDGSVTRDTWVVPSQTQVLLTDLPRTTEGGTRVAPSAPAPPTDIVLTANGVKCDGVTDDRAAIQALFDAYRPTSGGEHAVDRSPVFLFPDGVCLVSAPLTHYSGQTLRGTGPHSVIKAAGAFSGSALLVCGEPLAGDHQCTGYAVEKLAFNDDVKGLRAHTVAPTITLNSGRVEDLTLRTRYGLIYDQAGGSQSMYIGRIRSYGTLDQLLYLTGNRNVVEDLIKEGDTGSSAEPYVRCAPQGNGNGSFGNVFRDLLIEGQTSANKPVLRLDTCPNSVLENFWGEPNYSNGSLIELVGSADVLMRGNVFFTMAQQRLRLASGSSASIEQLTVSGTGTIDSILDLDSSSHLRVGNVVVTRASDLDLLRRRPNVIVERFRATYPSAHPPAGFGGTGKLRLASSQNLLANPSWEAGGYGWTFSPDATPAFVPSEFGSGSMLKLGFTSSTGWSGIAQPIAIPAGDANRRYTFSVLVKVTGIGYAAPTFVSGCGVSGTGSDYTVSSGTGWQVLSYTLTLPQTAACTLNVGLWFSHDASTVALLDEARFGLGDEPELNGAHWSSFELNGQTQTAASAPPATGAWKPGDFIWNRTPANGILGWLNVEAGSPGTWRPAHALSPQDLAAHPHDAAALTSGRLDPARLPLSATFTNVTAPLQRSHRYAPKALATLLADITLNGRTTPKQGVMWHFGDSMATAKWAYLRPYLTKMLGTAVAGNADGTAGGAFGGGAQTNLLLTGTYTAHDGSVPSDFDYWMTGKWWQMGDGSTATLQCGGAECVNTDQFRVYYIQEPGAGSFQFAYKPAGGAWTDAGTAVSAANAATVGAVATIAIPRGKNQGRITVTGNVKLLGWAYVDSTANGLIPAIVQSALMSDWMRTPAAIVDPILANLKPVAATLEHKDYEIYPATYKSTLTSWVQRVRTANPDADLLMLGTTDSGSTSYVAQNEAMRQVAQEQVTYFFDLNSLGLDYATMRRLGWYIDADTVHPTPVGLLAMSQIVLNDLGFGGWLSGYATKAVRADVLTNTITVGDGTTFFHTLTATAGGGHELKLNTGRGLQFIEGTTGTAKNYGFLASDRGGMGPGNNWLVPFRTSKWDATTYGPWIVAEDANTARIGGGSGGTASYLDLKLRRILATTALNAALSTPANSTATCTAGDIWADAGYLYVCTATNTIKRTALAAF